jgi:hypothetical protein
MKTEAYGDRTIRTGPQRRFQREGIVSKASRQLDAVAKREDRKKIAQGPIEPG